MMQHYELPSSRPCGGAPLIFDWNIETGTVTGPGAKQIIELVADGRTSAHPCPWAWDFGPDPLKSKTDMAAIVGWDHHLPPDLADFYPQWEDDGIPDVSYIDADGVEVLGRDRILY